MTYICRTCPENVRTECRISKYIRLVVIILDPGTKNRHTEIGQKAPKNLNRNFFATTTQNAKWLKIFLALRMSPFAHFQIWLPKVFYTFRLY